MAKDQVKTMIAQTFLDMADALESGRMGGRPKLSLIHISEPTRP